MLETSSIDITATVVDLDFRPLMATLQCLRRPHRGLVFPDAVRMRSQRVLVALRFTEMMCTEGLFDTRNRILARVFFSWHRWLEAASSAREGGMSFDYCVTADNVVVTGLSSGFTIW